MIIGSRKLDYVVHYRDLEFLDDETEYFKRYYATSETSTRIKKLISTAVATKLRLLRDQHDAAPPQPPPHPQLPHPRGPQPQAPQALRPPREGAGAPQHRPRAGGLRGPHDPLPARQLQLLRALLRQLPPQPARGNSHSPRATTASPTTPTKPANSAATTSSCPSDSTNSQNCWSSSSGCPKSRPGSTFSLLSPRPNCRPTSPQPPWLCRPCQLRSSTRRRRPRRRRKSAGRRRSAERGRPGRRRGRGSGSGRRSGGRSCGRRVLRAS